MPPAFYVGSADLTIIYHGTRSAVLMPRRLATLSPERLNGYSMARARSLKSILERDPAHDGSELVIHDLDAVKARLAEINAAADLA